MKEVYVVKDKEQIELISDPFAISIISLMENEAVTVEWVAAELGEKISLVTDYMDKLHKKGLLEMIEEGELPKYQRVARSYELDDINATFDGDIHNHWLLGFIHHLESNILDYLKITTRNIKDPKKLLKDLGYGESNIRYDKLYLTREEAQEFKDYLTEFFKNHHEKPEANQEEKLPYELAFFLTPELTGIRRLMEQKNKSGKEE